MIDMGSIIVMMTDFGTAHWYDAAMKGEILQRAPEARILDLSHNVPRQSIEQGAFVLHCAVDSFPSNTIFLCVVDPGVGSARRGMIGWVGDYGFVGPDNGLVTPLIERAGGFVHLHEIKSRLFRKEVVSPTFHGRDVFAPAAARMLLGNDPRLAGPKIDDPVLLPPVRAEEVDGRLIGKVMMIDHFGNAVTNISRGHDGNRLDAGSFKLSIRELSIEGSLSHYAEAAKGDLLCYWGSSGFLEVAVNHGSAAAIHGLEANDAITITMAT